MAEKVKKTVKSDNEKTKKAVVKKQDKKKDVKKSNDSYIKQVKKELKLVKWPSFKEVIKYTASTIVLCIILCLFFLLLNLGLSYVKGIFV